MPSKLRKQADIEKKQKTKKNLLDSAIKVFLLKGYHKTKISDIVTKAEVGQGTFYRYFNSKREIFEELLKELTEEIVLEFSSGNLNMKITPKTFTEYMDMSKAAFLQLVPIIDRNKDSVQLFLRDASTIDQDFEDEINEIFDQFVLLAKYYLDNAIENNFIRKCDTKIVAELIIGIVIHTLKNWLNNKYNNLHIEELVIESIKLVFLGLKV